MSHRPPSSSITYKWTYDVFLSFYGEDTRLGFTSHLHQALCQRGIRVFLDDECIRSGENITPTLFRAIEDSRIAIIVFSGNYANSTFCLRELAKILECFKEESRLIYPVFYHVDPSELRNPRESYAEALARLKERFKDEEHEVEKWRKALSQAADLRGCHLKPKIANEKECITRITNEVATRINQKPLHVTDYPVGLVPRVNEVVSYLDLWSTEKIKMMGIWGPGGIGKSTIARCLYNSIADNFEGLCFLSDVRKRSKEPNGLSHLQETLLSELVMAKDLNFGDYHEGIPIIRRRLSQKKILLILDDVDELDQLEALAGSCNWFGCGSRIIITTRDKQLLKSHGIESIYDVKGLNSEDSLKLLNWYAFKKENVDSYVKVCNRAVYYSCGFPLALKVIGSSLSGKGVNMWNSALQQFKRTPNGIVFDALKLSYDTLGKVEKQVFLDLACFFNGEKLANIIDILLCVRGIEPKYAIDTLIDKSLINIEQACVTMDNLIEDVGKEIVQQDSPNDPGEWSRLWFYQDILNVLQQDTGTKKVEAIILDLPESIEVQWSGEELMKMKNLKMLVIRNACFSASPKYLPNSLRWLEWKGYSFEFFPVLPTQLVYLDLSNSYCGFLQPFDKKCSNLSCMNLRNCKFLQQIPDLSGASNLTELWVDGCTNLIEIHDSVGCLNKLREFSAMRCTNLKIFPSRLKLTFLEHLNLFGCSSLQTFPEISIVMKEMQILDLDKTSITTLPSSVCNLVGLESLSMEECPNLKQLPASICTLPNLWKLTTNSCEGLSHFKMCEGGDEASLYCLAMSSKMEQLCFSNCNLSDDSLAFCLSHFTNMIHLDLSFNNFTILPECIKEYHNLKYLLLNNCIQLERIGGLPTNLDKFSAICCRSLTESSRRTVFKALNIQPRKRNFILPGKKLPRGLHYYYKQGSFVSFWVRNVFPMASLWIVFKDHRDYVYNYEFSVYINDTKVDVISSTWVILSRIMTDHIYICDMQSIIPRTELPLVNKWNEVKISFESEANEIYFGVQVYSLQSNVDNIQFMDPTRRIGDNPMYYRGFSQREIYDPPIGDGGPASVHVASNRVTRDAAAANSISESTNFNIWQKGESIGASRYGTVYVARNRETGDLCAVKEQKDIHKLGNTESIQNEIKILCQLEHANVVKYYGHEIVGCHISLYMEYIQPGSLEKYILKQGVLSEPLIRNFTAQILSGLVYLHSKRVAHRNIKPSNLLVDSNNIVKLVDFGLAKHLEESVGNHYSILSGTPYYTAPEVFDKRIEYHSSCEAYAADIWSLGCVIIEMFSGKHPWLSLHPGVVATVVSVGKQPPIPEKLCQQGKDFLELCFTRNPVDRPSASKLLDDPFVKPQTTSLADGRKYN